MKRQFVSLLLGVFVLTTVGCSGGSGSQAADDKDLRAKFAKDKFDMKDVPPNQRAMVQGFIDRSKQGQSRAASNSGQ